MQLAKYIVVLGALCLSIEAMAQNVVPARINEDYTYNLSSTGARELRYHPEGDGVVIVNGQQRFNRALYGAHTGFRLECSDTPEFGLYLPRMGGNAQFDFAHTTCTMRYEAGRTLYTLNSGLTIEAQVLRQDADAALWRIKNSSRDTIRGQIRFGGVADVKFYREGDLGVDPPDCFAFKPKYCVGNIYKVDGNNVSIEYGVKERQTLHLTLPTKDITITNYPSLEASVSVPPGGECYMAIYPNKNQLDMSYDAIPARFAEAEAYRKELARALTIDTPDPYITPIGEALALAADGLWSGEVWLHGAVGWRAPYSGWRGAYVGDALGWHQRARTHFNTYAANQVKNIPPIYPHPRQDSLLNLSRAQKLWGTQMYSNGYICRRPGQINEMSHYDMNLCYVDELLRHLNWTGDLNYAREIFPLLERHLEWEKRNFDPDGDHLYDAYCCIWASDALYYSSGAVTHSSAYNYYANKRTAEIAQLIGIDPTPYITEAEAILKALNNTLWIDSAGHWAEYKDFGGHKRLHTSAAVWTIYHAIDSEVGDPIQNYAATRYVDKYIPHIPVVGSGLPKGDYAVISTTSWKPYSWSINNVAVAEIMHTALAYWQAGRAEEAFRLMKSVALDNMYMGGSPLNFGQISYYDAARGECYRDFGDPIGVWSRALVEGLYGIMPDALHGRLTIRPGFPAAWNEAKVEMTDLSYSFNRTEQKDIYKIEQHFATLLRTTLSVSAPTTVRSVKVNGKKVNWSSSQVAFGSPQIEIELGAASSYLVEIERGQPLKPIETGEVKQIGADLFTAMRDGKLLWWKVEEIKTDTTTNSGITDGFESVNSAACRVVDLAPQFNASVSDIFNNEYLSPRSPYTTLQIPTQGIGEWCHPTHTAKIDDSGLRAMVGADGTIFTSIGVPFSTPRQGSNIIYTSLWDNYPVAARVPISGQASHAYLLLAGSTNHMQYGIANGIVRVEYTDGTVQELVLENPTTWLPIEQDIYYDNHAFAPELGQAPPYRLHLMSGLVSRHLGRELGIKGVYGREIEGGAAMLLDMPLDSTKSLRFLDLETLSNDVVIGLIAITLQDCGVSLTKASRPEAKPYVRWWWLGSAVDRAGLDFNLSEFARQGIGGVEITPIYGVHGNEANDIPYLSPKWMEMFDYTIKRAKELGIQVDMSNCTGWPFGGPWVSAEDAAAKYIIETFAVESGDVFKLPTIPSDPKQQPVAHLQAIQAVEAKTGKRLDLMNYYSKDNPTWSAPKGSWTIYALFSGRTFQKVKRAAPGGEGLVLNHYDSMAVKRYLSHFDNAFAANNTPFPDTFFNDSYEVYGASWSDDFLQQFEKDHSYRLQDYLPEFAAQGNTDSSARIINDYRTTLEAMLLHNFTEVWTRWAHSHGSRTRNQAHGSPANIFDLYAAVDIPECESFGWSNLHIIGMHPNPDAKSSDADPAVLKFASSASNVTGKHLTSCESLTWLTEHFHTSPALCKGEIDQILTSGVNHLYFHGAPYSPVGVDFPNWLFYASINLSPTAPLWQDASALFEYVERCQAALQASKPDNDFLLYIPMDDIRRATQRKNYLQFEIHKMDQTMPQLKSVMNRIVSSGYDADYISDRYVASLRVTPSGDIETVGGAKYAALLLPSVKEIPTATLRKLLTLAEEGAKIMFLDNYPKDVSGFAALDERRAKLRTELNRLPTTNFSTLNNNNFGSGHIITGGELESFLAASGARPEPLKRMGAQLVRRVTDKGELYFISMLSENSIDGWVEISSAAQKVVITDPLTGSRGLAAIRPTTHGGTEVYIQLRSGESLLLETINEASSKPKPEPEPNWAYYTPPSPSNAITGSHWTLDLPAKDFSNTPIATTHYNIPAPCDWTTLSPEMATFCGTGRYSALFHIDNLSQGDDWLLDLGDVRASARVRVNGHDASIAWSVPFIISVGKWLKVGDNTIEISVTNLPANRMADLDRRSVPWRIFKDANIVSSAYNTLSCGEWATEPSGLLTNIFLYPVNKFEPK